MEIDNTLVNVVIPAAGTGERCGKCIPKQFSIVCNYPLVYHTINAFLRFKCLLFVSKDLFTLWRLFTLERIEWINQIIVVSSIHYETKMKEIISSLPNNDKIITVTGGITRHRSIANGVNAIVNSSLDDIVVIHDGARPMVDEKLLKEMVYAAHHYGSSGPICKLTSTVVRVTDDGFLSHALNRDEHRASEMPQAFKYCLIKEAYEKCSEYDYDHNTECLDLVQRYASSRVKLIEGCAENLWKVTYNKDLYIADGLLREYQNISLQIIVTSECDLNENITEEMKLKLNDNFKNINFDDSVKTGKETFKCRITLIFCQKWNDIQILNFSESFDTSICIVITKCSLTSDCYGSFHIWAKQMSRDLRNICFIHSNISDIESDSSLREKLFSTVIFLTKYFSHELSGQILFI